MADNLTSSQDSSNGNETWAQDPVINNDASVDQVSTTDDLIENQRTKEEKRELTQTDHLNQRLLRSFLDKLNQPNSGFPQIARFDTTENKDTDNEDAGFGS